MGKEEKLSFSFSSSSSSSRPHSTKRPQSFRSFDDDPAAAETKPQFVTVFDPAETLAASNASSKTIIPPLPNSDFRTGIKKMKNLLPDPSTSEPPSESKFVLDSNSSSIADPSGISYGLTLRSDAPKPPQSNQDLTLRRFQEDMKNLPEDRGMDEFADVPVEGFGAAILAGYGWKEGKAVGRNSKEDTKVIQYDRRAGTEGLGYAPSADDPKNWRKKGSRDKVRAGEETLKPAAPVVVRVVSGRHVGMKGEILERFEGSELLLRLIQSCEKVRVEEEMVAELGSKAEERCLSKLKELDILDRRKEKEEASNGKSSSLNYRSSGNSERSPVRWLMNHIRVRIISKDFKRGKCYLKKGVVVDVVGPTTCDITMDGSGELVQGVDQGILETALPKRGGSVLVLCGKHKGVYGSLVERDMEEETGVVRDADSHALINVRLEQIAEYVGDPSYLGY